MGNVSPCEDSPAGTPTLPGIMTKLLEPVSETKALLQESEIFSSGRVT